jgi:hypothetical protein
MGRLMAALVGADNMKKRRTERVTSNFSEAINRHSKHPWYAGDMKAVQPHHDRRKTPRLPLGNLVASIDFRDGSDPKTTCVWDLSLAGACLLVPADVVVPDEFELVIDGVSHPVKKVWRRDSYVGVELCLATRAALAEPSRAA